MRRRFAEVAMWGVLAGVFIGFMAAFLAGR
jgi:uncharacterized membrane protein